MSEPVEITLIHFYSTSSNPGVKIIDKHLAHSTAILPFHWKKSRNVFSTHFLSFFLYPEIESLQATIQIIAQYICAYCPLVSQQLETNFRCQLGPAYPSTHVLKGAEDHS